MTYIFRKIINIIIIIIVVISERDGFNIVVGVGMIFDDDQVKARARSIAL